jgi:Tol biopolymer transport system component
MPLKEALFWIGITVFGTGLFFVAEGGGRAPLAILLTAAGMAMVAYSVYAYDGRKAKAHAPVEEPTENPTAARNASPVKRRKKRWPIVVATAIAMAAGVATDFLYHSRIAALITSVLPWRSTSHPAPSVLRLSVDPGDDAALTPRRGASMALSPDGSRLVFVTGRPLVKSRLAVRRLDQANSLPLAGTDGAEAPFFSPDGKFIAFFADGKLKKIDASGGTPVTLCDAPSQRAGSWGDDDNIVFAATNHGGLSSVPASGGTPRPVTKLDPERGEDTHRYPQVLPGARAVIFMNSLNAAGEGIIEVLSLKTGERKPLVQTGAYPRYLPSGHLVYLHHGTLFAVPMDVARLELTGSPAPVLEDVAFYPGTGVAGFTFSQSGVFAYVAANPEDQMQPIGVMDEKGKVEMLPLAKARYSHPRVSPDGARLSVTVQSGSDTNVWIYEWASHRFSRFPFPNGDSNNAIWTPDGKHLIFFSNAQTPGPGIYCMRADGVGEAVRLVDGTGLVPNSLSSKAAWLLYQTQGGANPGFWVLPLDWSDTVAPKPGPPKHLPERPSHEGAAAFSPDGRWLAYVGSVSGTPEVLVRPFPGAGGPWPISSGGNNPFWSSKGGELFYRSLQDFSIMVASYSVAGDSFSPARPRQWNDQRVESFDLMPDGKHIVMIPTAEQKEATRATFLLNFMDDLQRRVPSGK